MKERYLETLKKYRQYLNCSKNRFRVFEEMNFDRLEQNNGNTWMVASILEKIISYALIVEAFDDYEFNLIENSIRLVGRENEYQEASHVFCACHDLVMDAIDNNCKNPSFLMFKDCVNGYKLYEILIEGMCYSLEDVDDEDKRLELVELIDTLDSPVLDTDDQITKLIAGNLSPRFTTAELLEFLSKLAKEKYKTHLLIDNEGTFIDEKTIYKSPKRSSVDISNNIMAELFMKLNYSDIGFCLEKTDLLEQLNSLYKQYKYYQYDYIKNKKTTESMIEKCKLT